MLRASIESDGGEVDLRGVSSGDHARESAIDGAEALVLFAEAVVGCASEEEEGAGRDTPGAKVIADTRARVVEELGSEAAVDAAGIIGNFERMVRIADGTGIPLDVSVAMATASIRGDLGIDRFSTSERAPKVRAWHRIAARMGWSVARRFLRRSGRRAGR